MPNRLGERNTAQTDGRGFMGGTPMYCPRGLGQEGAGKTFDPLRRIKTKETGGFLCKKPGLGNPKTAILGLGREGRKGT